MKKMLYVGLLLASVAQAQVLETPKSQIYKVATPSGPLFTDVAPKKAPEKKVERIEILQSVALPTTNQLPMAKAPMQAASAPQNSAQVQTDEAFKEERRRQCIRAKLNSTALNAGGQIQMMDNDGNKTTLDEKGIEKERIVSEKSVKAWCD